MTIIEQIALANEKVAHWQHKQGHAQAMLAKWQSRLTALQFMAFCTAYVCF